MRPGAIDSRFLANGMRAFLVVLEQAERAIRAEPDGSVTTDSLTRPESLRTALSNELDNALRASERHGYLPGSPAITQTRSLIALVADCRLLDLDWIGHDAWRDQPLAADGQPEADPATVGMAAADAVATADTLAQQAHALLDDRAQPTFTGPARAARAEVYLLALSLLPTSAEDAENQLPARDSDLIAALLATIASERGDAGERPNPLFSEAYRHTQRRGSIPRLPNPRGWQLALVLVVTALFLSTFVLWFRATESVQKPVLDLLRLLGT